MIKKLKDLIEADGDCNKVFQYCCDDCPLDCYPVGMSEVGEEGDECQGGDFDEITLRKAQNLLEKYRAVKLKRILGE